jgi:Tol biopolymer transport system component
LLLCLLVCGCSGARSQHGTREILVIGGARSDNPVGRLAVVRADGTGFHWLSRTSAIEARWSPDGRRIAFIAGASPFTNPSPANSLLLMDADGHGQRELAHWHGSAPLILDWSPEGRRILYQNGDSGLWSTRPDGSGKRRLARDVFEAEWSPDGHSIVFTVSGGGRLNVMNAGGNGVKRLATDAQSPRWLPDGKTIVYVRALEGDVGEVYAVSIPGGKPHLVVRRREAFTGVTISDASPDGRSVLVGTGSALWVVRIHGGIPRRVAQGALYQGEWSPDGRRIAFVCDPGLCIVGANGGKPRVIKKAPRGVVFSRATWRP